MRLLYDFLPADEEANRLRYFVPSPQEIAEKRKQFREARLRIKREGGETNGFRADIEPDTQAHAPPVRRRPL